MKEDFMTAQETATLAQQGEKLDALSYAVREIKDMLTKRDDMCAIHTETIARIATRLDSLDREVERVKNDDIQSIKADIDDIRKTKSGMFDKLILLFIGIGVGIAIEMIKHMAMK